MRAGAVRATCLLLFLASCATEPRAVERAAGRLAARPHAPSRACGGGVQRLGLSSERDALLYVPAAVATARAPAPLLLLLHGAGGRPERSIERMSPYADATGVILVAPSSRDHTWDGIHGVPGPDVAFIDRALDAVFDRCAVDASRLAVGGFSDGASYALTLGIANGDLFGNVIAFSPCLIAEGIVPNGKPKVFLSHGRSDTVLPINQCGRPLSLNLRRHGYLVRYEEFDGEHEVPAAIAEKAFRDFAGR